jgi:hypothetical protein
MKEHNYFTRITKEEHISNLDHDIIPNTFVLEMNQPFPAYYGGQFLTSKSKPGSLLLVLKEEADFEDFFRAVKSIQSYCKHSFDAALAKIYVYNMEYSAVRLRHLDAFTDIKEIQSGFMNEGFEMLKPRELNTKALIKISKFTSLVDKGDGIFLDADNEHFSYFQVPFKINWKQFEKSTNHVRRNIDSATYDVAKGVFYTKDGMIDFVRVYTEKITPEELKAIQAKYLQDYSRI